MHKKLVISLAPMLATAVFVATPALARAAGPHYYKNGVKMAEGERVPYISWGHLALTDIDGTGVECENAVSGWEENPLGGGPGKAETNGWTAYNCTNTECEDAAGKVGVIFENENTPSATPVKLEWPAELTEKKAGTIRLHTTNVRVTIRCVFASLPTEEKPDPENEALELRTSSEITSSAVVSCTAATPGFSEPKWTNGISIGVAPSKVVFNKAGGELQCGSISGKVITTGELKSEGFSEQELITTAAD